MNNLNDIFFAPTASEELSYEQILEDVQRYFAENHAVATVSYTHLDVYKRQGYFPATLLLSPNQLHQHSQWHQNGAQQPQRLHLRRHLPVTAGKQFQRVFEHPLSEQQL